MVAPRPPFLQDEPLGLGGRGSTPVPLAAPPGGGMMGGMGGVMGGFTAPPPALQPDAILDPAQMMEELLGRNLETLAPKYPSWLYRNETVTDPFTGLETTRRKLSPPKKPTAAQFQDWIQADAMLYSALLSRFRDDLRMYRGLKIGIWRQYNPDTDANYQSAEPVIQVNKIMSMLSGSLRQIRFPARTQKEREQAARMEAAAYWLIEQIELHHRQSGHQEFYLDLGFYALVFGRQVVQCIPDLGDGEYPWWISTLDPGTCFPIWGHGKRGMIRASRMYTTTLYDVLDEFDPNEQDKLVEKLKKKENASVDGSDLTVDVSVSECHTRWHRYVEVDGIELERVDHELGYVPFIYNIAIGEGETNGTPGMGTGRDADITADDVRRGFGFQTATSSQRDMVNRGQSFFHPMKSALMQKEKVLGLTMVGIEQTVNPATQTTSPYPTPPAPPDLGPGGNNTLRPGESRAPIVPAPRPVDSGPVMQDLNNQLAKGFLPDQVFGVNDASNVTGFASESQINAAMDRIGSYFTLTQNTTADLIVMAFGQFRNHGQHAEGLSDGKLILPSTNRGYGPLGAKKADLPPWGRDVMVAILQSLAAPGGPLGSAPPTPPVNAPPGGGGPTMSPVAGPSPATMGMMPGASGGSAGFIGLPGFVDPAWTLPPDGIFEDEPLVFLDAETIDAVAARPKVTLANLSLNNKTALINYLTQAVNGKLMSRAVAMEELPENTNAFDAFQQIMAEEGMTNPQMLQNIYYPRSLAAQGDMDAWLTYMALTIVPQIKQALMMGNPAAMMAAGGGSSPPGGGGGGQAPIEQPPNGIQTGQSAAMLGRGPGANGSPVGRPG